MSLLDLAGVPPEEREQRREWWEDHWKGMPEFRQDDLGPKRTIKVHFKDQAAVDAFAKLIEQAVTDKTQSVWFPKADFLRLHITNKEFVGVDSLLAPEE